jgi:hypothetical protein
MMTASPKEEISREINYRGFLIITRPVQLEETQRWTMDIEILRKGGSLIEGRRFSGRDTLATEEEAINQSLSFGKRIVDREFPELPVDDL